MVCSLGKKLKINEHRCYKTATINTATIPSEQLNNSTEQFKHI